MTVVLGMLSLLLFPERNIEVLTFIFGSLILLSHQSFLNNLVGEVLERASVEASCSDLKASLEIALSMVEL